MKWLDKFFLRRAISVLNKYDDDGSIEIDSVESDRKLSNQLRKIRNQLGSQASARITAAREVDDDEAEFNRAQAMRFTIHPAQGGYIIELRVWNAKFDRYDQQLHLIPDDSDMSESISKIITLELLRR